MRLWSIHPKYLDTDVLVALWDEALLAQKILSGKPSPESSHPQLQRFLGHSDPLLAIGGYLLSVHDEAVIRGYRFGLKQIGCVAGVAPIPLTIGQLHFEWHLFISDLKNRDEALFQHHLKNREILPHPIFNLINGEVAEWEEALQGMMAGRKTAV